MYIDHFNNLKGKNSYSECTNLVYAGTLHFGDPYYILKALTIDQNNVKTLETFNGNGHYFKDEFLRMVERNDKEAYMMQDLFRIAIRKFNNDKPINFFIFERDAFLIEALSKNMPDCKIIDWYPEFLDAPKIKELKKCLSKTLKKDGDKITKKSVIEMVNLSEDYFRKNLLHDQRFKIWLDENNIKKEHHYFIKLPEAS